MDVTLGAYVADRTSAAAVAVDGRVVSAMSGVRGRHAIDKGVPQASIETVLRLAKLTAADVTRVVIADEDLNVDLQVPRDARARSLCDNPAVWDALCRKPPVRVARLHAEAAQFRGDPRDGVVVAVDAALPGHGSIFLKQGGALRCLDSIPGIRPMLHVVGAIASAIGEHGDNPISALDACYGTVDESIDAALNAAIRTDDGVTIDVNENVVQHALAQARQRSPASLEARDSIHVAVQRMRTAMATSTLNRVADVLSALARKAQSHAGVEFSGFSGSAFESAALSARVRSHLDGASFALVSEPIGAALGAALLPHGVVAELRDLSLGPAYSDQEIKADLENCRLDYVYEPDWNKLILRASELLGAGATVAWFQGRLEFGMRSFGGRSILCDPSNQYARENVNVFLLRRSIHTPLPVSVAAAATPSRDARSLPPRFAYASAECLPAGHDRLTSAIDRHGRCFMHVTDAAATPELHRLLDVHYRRTGVPGLINVPLASADCLTVTPRDAVREVFGSAVDALVVGRFLVSKDYWLLRSRQALRP